MKKRSQDPVPRQPKTGEAAQAPELQRPAEPMFQPGNLHYEMAERGRAIGFGGIGAVHAAGDAAGLGPGHYTGPTW